MTDQLKLEVNFQTQASPLCRDAYINYIKNFIERRSEGMTYAKYFDLGTIREVFNKMDRGAAETIKAKPAIIKELLEWKKSFDQESKDISKVYHVSSGLDAFEFILKDGTRIYSPYVAIIAKSPEEAIEIANKLIPEIEGEEADNAVYSHAVYQYTF